MSAWEWFRGWPVWLQVPAFAVAASLAVLVGFVAAESLFPSPEVPVAEVQLPTTSGTSTTTTSTSTTVPPTTTTTVRATTTTRGPVRLTNPIDIWYACENEARQLIGRELTGSEGGEAAALYQERERAAQQPGATVLAPALDAWCRTWIRDRFPNELRNPNAPDYTRALENIFGGPASDTTLPRSTIPPGGVCHRTNIGKNEYQAPRFGSCPMGWELIR